MTATDSDVRLGWLNLDDPDDESDDTHVSPSYSCSICGAVTRDSKPVCSDHISSLPYTQDVVTRSMLLALELDAALRQPLPISSPLLREVIAGIWEQTEGRITIPRLRYTLSIMGLCEFMRVTRPQFRILPGHAKALAQRLVDFDLAEWVYLKPHVRGIELAGCSVRESLDALEAEVVRQLRA